MRETRQSTKKHQGCTVTSRHEPLRLWGQYRDAPARHPTYTRPSGDPCRETGNYIPWRGDMLVCTYASILVCKTLYTASQGDSCTYSICKFLHYFPVLQCLHCPYALLTEANKSCVIEILKVRSELVFPILRQLLSVDSLPC